MKQKISLNKWKYGKLGTENYYVDLEDESTGSVSSVHVFSNGKLVNEDFISEMIEVADKAYALAGIESASSKLYQGADEERMQALKDLKYILFPVSLTLESYSDRIKKMTEITNRWEFLLTGATEPEGKRMES